MIEHIASTSWALLSYIPYGDSIVEWLLTLSIKVGWDISSSWTIFLLSIVVSTLLTYIVLPYSVVRIVRGVLK